MTIVRTASIPFKVSPIDCFADYADHATRLITSSVEIDKPDFILLPELTTFELATTLKNVSAISVLLEELSAFTDDYLALYKNLAMKESVYIIAGSQITKIDGKLYNMAYLFTPGGRIEIQPKLHGIPRIEGPFITPGDKVSVFDTEKGKIAIMICYDVEFPEPSRIAAFRHADILFVPTATSDEQGYWRVRHCAQARCVENQVYAVVSYLLGDTGIPGVSFWGKSAILAPCDKKFPNAGIVVETLPNEEIAAVADLDIGILVENREMGTVQPMKDKRSDLLETLYRLQTTK